MIFKRQYVCLQRREVRWRIRLDESGFSLANNFGRRERVMWNAICKMAAYKADLFSFDLVCIEMVLGDSRLVTVDEQMENWDKWLAAAENELPTMRRDWWGDVVLPAFETNWTQIYTMPSSTP